MASLTKLAEGKFGQHRASLFGQLPRRFGRYPAPASFSAAYILSKPEGRPPSVICSYSLAKTRRAVAVK